MAGVVGRRMNSDDWETQNSLLVVEAIFGFDFPLLPRAIEQEELPTSKSATVRENNSTELVSSLNIWLLLDTRCRGGSEASVEVYNPDEFVGNSSRGSWFLLCSHVLLTICRLGSLSIDILQSGPTLFESCEVRCLSLAPSQPRSCENIKGNQGMAQD